MVSCAFPIPVFDDFRVVQVWGYLLGGNPPFNSSKQSKITSCVMTHEKEKDI